MSDVQYLDQLLTGLKVIGSIKEGQKVCVRNGLINIEQRSQGIFTGLLRWVNNDNRITTMSYIRNIIINSIDLSNKITEYGKSIIAGLDNAVVGLNALRVTYNLDAGILASIDVLVDRIEKHKNNII